MYEFLFRSVLARHYYWLDITIFISSAFETV